MAALLVSASLLRPVEAAAGDLDPTFGTGGKVITDFTDAFGEVSGVAIQSDGRVVVAGRAGIGSTSDFMLARYNADGSLDDGAASDSTPADSFGSGGKVTTDFANPAEFGEAVAIQCDGKIVVAGRTASFSDVDFALARYDSNGALDAAFGSGGKVITDFGSGDAANALALQSDGKIVAAGSTVFGNTIDFALARYDGGACGTAAPCPQPQGYWKNNPDAWPVTSLTLGDETYTQAELLALLNTSTTKDASLILARQLIAAKLNLENGSDPAPVSSVVAHADGLLSGYGGKLPYQVKPSSDAGQAMVADAGVLDSYNNGLLTPGCVP